MDPDSDPVAGFARAMQTMAETQQYLAESGRRVEGMQQYIAQTQRLGHSILAFQCVMIGLALIGLGVVLWYTIGHSQEHAAQTQALLELVRRSSGH